MDKILIYNSGGGLGDSIQLFPLIISLKNHFKKSQFYYLGAHKNHFKGKLKEYNIKLETLDLGLKYFGFRWWHLFFTRQRFAKTALGKFDLIIDLQTKFRNSLILKKIPHNSFYSRTFNGFFSSKKINSTSVDHIENLSLFFGEDVVKLDFKVNKLNKNLLLEAKKLLPNSNYVGFSITQGNIYRKKSWSFYKFTSLANKILSKNKIPVFFIEKNNIQLIEKIKNQVPSALFPEIKSKLACPALITALSSRLDKAISIDNGIMHMMSLANVPMIVLFGPTNSDKFAPNNNFTTILDSKKIHKTKDINSIEVDEVLSLI
ncbi:lipopolysaccharide heptosyltransferase family protein [Candidatus Pelagibacter bacterium]|nr:lipopolysaccharide heptosyltransferase family protein [Candidatus Pelagibacter bacterium]